MGNLLFYIDFILISYINANKHPISLLFPFSIYIIISLFNLRQSLFNSINSEINLNLNFSPTDLIELVSFPFLIFSITNCISFKLIFIISFAFIILY